MLYMANIPAGWEQWVWRTLRWSLTHTSQSLAHGGDTDLPPRARKGLELPLVSTNVWNPFLPPLAAKAYRLPMPAAFPCSRHAGFDGIILLPLVDVGLLELTKPHLLILPQCSCPAHAHPLAMTPVGW